MRLPAFARDLILVSAALVFGWWLRGTEKPVFAQRGAADNLAFEMLGTGPDSTLVMYNRDTRSLYVYARAGG